MNKSTRLNSLCFGFLLLSPFVAFAQTSGTATVTPQAEVSTESDHQEAPQTDTMRNFFGQTLAGHWSFTTEANFNQEYDDNVFSSGLIRLSDNVSRISARFTAAVQKKKLRVQMHYYPNYVSYAKYSGRNALSHQYSQEIDYKWSGRTDLNWSLFGSRSPGSTNSPFRLVAFNGVFLPVFRPDTLQSDATISNATSNMSWAHRFSARETLTVGLNGSMVLFNSYNGVPLSPFVSSKSFSNGATVRWEDEFVPKRKLGVEFGDQYFGFLDPGSHSHYQFVKARYSQSFGRGYLISVGAGPSRRERQAVATFSSSATQSLGYAIDASLSKTSERQSMGLTYSHGSQLGLSQGTLGSDSVSLSVLRHIGRKWSVNGSFGFSRSQGETILLQSISNSYSTSASLGYQLHPDLEIDAGYSYVNQAIQQSLPGALDFDRNVIRLGVRYTFQWITSR